MRIGYIGLGDIGAPMALRMHRAGLDLIVWNRTGSRLAPFVAAGVRTASSPADLAGQVDVLFLCIDTPEGIDEVLFGPVGVTSSSRSLPRLVVDSSTMHPAFAQHTAERLALSGVSMLDAPVSGGPLGAAAGTLSVFVGGAAEDLELARPALASFAGRVTHLGPLGCGQVGKLCNQVVNFATMAAIAEATALARSFGLDSQALPAAMTGGLADSAMLREYVRASSAGEAGGITGMVNGLRAMYTGGSPDAPEGGRVDVLLKDLDALIDVARAHRSAAPLSGAMSALFRMLQHRWDGR
jgi:3-hydroxyisobutyrate dehydrogenase